MDEKYCPQDCLIEPYMDKHLGDKERKAFEEHLTVCAACREQLALAERMDNLLSEMEEEKAPMWLAERVIARARDIAPGAFPSERYWMGWVGAALVAMGFVGLIVMIVILITTNSGVAPAVASTASQMAGTTSTAMESNSNWMLWFALAPVGYGAYKAAQAIGYV